MALAIQTSHFSREVFRRVYTQAPDPFDEASLYPALLGVAHHLCRVNRLPIDMAEDFVHETYIRFRAIGQDGGETREQQYGWLRNCLLRLIEAARRREKSASGYWDAHESRDALMEIWERRSL